MFTLLVGIGRGRMQSVACAWRAEFTTVFTGRFLNYPQDHSTVSIWSMPLLEFTIQSLPTTLLCICACGGALLIYASYFAKIYIYICLCSLLDQNHPVLYASRDVCSVIQSCVACAACSLPPPSSITPIFLSFKSSLHMHQHDPACTCANTTQVMI
jgi:hypothetical protein